MYSCFPCGGLSASLQEYFHDSLSEFLTLVVSSQLWMGTHPKGPCFNAQTSESLSDFVTANPDCVGTKVKEQFLTQGQLPFLFKVLSVNLSLSIQAHPNKVGNQSLMSYFIRIEIIPGVAGEHVDLPRISIWGNDFHIRLYVMITSFSNMNLNAVSSHTLIAETCWGITC